MRHNTFNQTSVRAILVLLIISLFIPLTAFNIPSVAYAADGAAVNFDSTDVMDDLTGSALNGVPFDVADYPYDKNGELQVLGFVEYCYSEYENLRGNYGLYLYIYNPALLDIATGTGSNRIEMATEYSEDGTPTAYNKFALQFCGVSDGVEANRFWKFKIADSAYFLDKVSVNARSYYVSGVEIQAYGSEPPVELPVKMQYIWTGFAEGYGSESAGSLKCDAEQMETIELEVQHTSYITGMSSLGNGHYNHIHTAYFAVPNYFFENYGRLQKIFAEWYEYKLKNMLVTRDRDLFNLASQHIDHGLGEYANDEPLPNLYKIWFGLQETNTQYSRFWEAEWAYNETNHNYDSGGINYIYNIDEEQHILPLVFYSELDDPYEIFEFLNKYFKTAGSVDSSELINAIYNYSNNLGNGYVDPIDRKISKDLFYDYVDDGRIYGFQQREVDFDDTFELDSYDSNHDWWDKLLDFGIFGKPEDTGEDLTVQPIYDVKETDLNGNDEDIANRLYINERDVDTFKEYYNTYKDTHHIILFRFANTDYFSRAAGYWLDRNGDEKLTNDERISEDQTQAYVCSETIFLNFDIISLTFNDDGEYRVFPVVSDPIDVVGDLKPPADSEFAEDLEEFGQTVKDFFDKIADWFKESWESIKIALIVIGAVIAVILIVWIISKLIGVFSGGKKTRIKIDVPKETGTVQNARKKKPAKTVSQTKRK